MAGSCSLGKQNKQNIGSNTCVFFFLVKFSLGFAFCSSSIQDQIDLVYADGNQTYLFNYLLNMKSEEPILRHCNDSNPTAMIAIN